MKYDVFISYKSEDYHLALPIHHFLTDQGLNVFLADVELRKKGRDVYGEIIDAALESADHLIVFTSKASYVNTTYVKSEWRTFVERNARDAKPEISSPNQSVSKGFNGCHVEYPL